MKCYFQKDINNFKCYNLIICSYIFILFTPIVPTATNEPAVTEMPEEPYLKLFKKMILFLLHIIWAVILKMESTKLNLV